MNFGVIGAGVVGLTTALELQKEFPNARISVLAEKFGVDTTSDVAAGLFRPSQTFTGPSPDITKQWMRDSYDYWDNLHNSADSSLAGVCQISGYIFSRKSPDVVKNHHMEDVVHTYRRATEEELGLCEGGWKYGSYFVTLLTECGLYLPHVLRKFREAGGVVSREKLLSFDNLVGRFDVVVNCSGLGARELCNDLAVIPVRGQVIKVKAPWIKMAFYSENDTYIIPGFRSVTLGGCYESNNFNTTPCEAVSRGIRERCYSMLPSLKRSEFLCERVGLRPHRSVVRVESETVLCSTGKQLKVIHNYGHGGYGVTTAPGTAMHAVKLVKNMLSASNKSKL